MNDAPVPGEQRTVAAATALRSPSLLGLRAVPFRAIARARRDQAGPRRVSRSWPESSAACTSHSRIRVATGSNRQTAVTVGGRSQLELPSPISVWVKMEHSSGVMWKLGIHPTVEHTFEASQWPWRLLPPMLRRTLLTQPCAVPLACALRHRDQVAAPLTHWLTRRPRP